MYAITNKIPAKNKRVPLANTRLIRKRDAGPASGPQPEPLLQIFINGNNVVPIIRLQEKLTYDNAPQYRTDSQLSICKFRNAKPSPGAPKKVAALISAARMDAKMAHQGKLRFPKA